MRDDDTSSGRRHHPTPPDRPPAPHPRADRAAGAGLDASAGAAEAGTGEAAPAALVEATVRVPVPHDPDDADLLRRGIARLAAVAHPHLAVLRQVQNEGQHLSLTYGVATGSRPLAALLTDREPLAAGQVVTVGVPWSQALAALHAANLVVGRADAADLWLAPDGRPALLAPGVRPGNAAASGDDVAALARVLRRLAPGSMPGALALVLLRAADDDPGARPSADEFARSLLAATPPEPLTRRRDRPPARASREGAAPSPAPVDAGSRPVAPPLPDPIAALRARVADEPPADRVGTRPTHRSRLRSVAVIGAVVALALAGWSVAASGRTSSTHPDAAGAKDRTTPAVASSSSPGGAMASGTAGTSPRPSGGTVEPPAVPDPAAAGWEGVLTALDAARSRAFATGDEAALDVADLAGSPAHAADVTLLRRFAVAGVRPDGFALDVVSVRELTRTGAQVVLDVVDRRPGYRLLDATGAVVATRPARGPARWHVTVAPDTAGVWRVRSVASRPS